MGVQLPRVGVRELVAYMYKDVCVIDQKHCASPSPIQWHLCEFVKTSRGADESGLQASPPPISLNEATIDEA